MNLKKLCGAIAVSIAALTFSYTPTFAQIPSKYNKKLDNRLEEYEFTNNLVSKLFSQDFDKDYDLFCKTFEKEFDKAFEIELKKRGMWQEMQIFLMDQEGKKIFQKDNAKEDKELMDYAEKAAQKAATKALERTIEEFEFLDRLEDLVKGFTRLEIIKKKRKKAEIKNPLEKDPAEKIEDKVEKLEDEVKDLEKAKDFKKSDELKEEVEKLKDELYKKRKFKVSFGLNLEYDQLDELIKGGFKDWGSEVYLKLKSRYLDGKIGYSTQDNRIRLSLNKEFWKKLNIDVATEYKEVERYVVDILKEQYELTNGVTISKEFSNRIIASVYHFHNWKINQDLTSASVSKIVYDEITITLSGTYNWQSKDKVTNLSINFEF